MISNGEKTRKTALIMLGNFLTTMLTSIFSLIINQKILAALGSDYNGVNSTASQIITILTLIEGGFTLAAQVALYKPIANGDLAETSKVISFTARKMRIYGILTLLSGVVVSVIYAGFVKSDLTYYTILWVMLLAVIGAAFNLGVVSQYRVLFQVTQTEYKYAYVNIASQFLLYFAVCFVLNTIDSIIAIRVVYLLIEMLRGVVTIVLARRIFKDIDYHADVGGVQIKGTRDVFIAKITALIYNSAPVLFISTFVGTASTSVYAVYLSVTNIISSVLTGIVNAPMHGLGQLIAESEDENKHRHLISVYNEYETLIAIANAFLCSVTFIMLMPFVSLYTRNVTDTNYVDMFFTITMVLILLIQVMHIPCGTCINVAGRFKAVRNIQLTASAVLVISIAVGTFFGELKGLLIGKLFTAIILAIIEIVYNYKAIIRCKLTMFAWIFMTTYVPVFIICAVEYVLIIKRISVSSWIQWGLLGCVICIVNGIYLFMINLMFNRKALMRLFNRFTKSKVV